MLRGTLATAAVVAASGAVLAAPALAARAAAATSSSVTATGSSQTKVKPKDRHSNASIVAAVNAAQKAGVKPAIADAREYAEIYAKAAGLTLGSIIAVSDNVANSGYGVATSAVFGPFGPNKYCGTIDIGGVRIVKRNGKLVKKIIKPRKVHRCFVPSSITTTLAVTWSAS
jgi:hypothetical protein